MVRAYALPAMENVALWHERDISHSSVERMIGPDATVTLDFALARLASIIDKLVVYPATMQKNLDKLGGLIHSQRVLIALTQKGVPREDAYRLVQRNAMKVWGGESDFLSLLKGDKDVRAKLSDKELEANFNLDHHFKHVDTIFKRVVPVSDETASRSRLIPCATPPPNSTFWCCPAWAIPASIIGNPTGVSPSVTPHASCRTTGTNRRLHPGSIGSTPPLPRYAPRNPGLP